jgi:hypothetical protein
METDPVPTPLRVRVDQQEFTEITSVIVEEGVLTLVDTEGWCTSMAPGSWSRVIRVDEQAHPDVPGTDPRNLG